MLSLVSCEDQGQRLLRALSPGHGLLHRIPLSHGPSLQGHLRQASRPGFVPPLHSYYAHVRLLAAVHVGVMRHEAFSDRPTGFPVGDDEISRFPGVEL